MVLNTVAEKLLALAREMKDQEVYDRLKGHYQLITLLDDQGQWCCQALEDQSEVLLPKASGVKDLEEMIQTAATALGRNEYLMKFFQEAEGKDFPYLRGKFEEEAAQVIPDVLTYSLMLEILTREAAKNVDLLVAIYDSFRQARKVSKSFKVLPAFHKIKLLSVELPIKKYFSSLRTGKVPPKAGGTAVSINIWEATLTEKRSGNKGNAYAGKVLAKNKCGRKKLDPATGAGPSKLSPTGLAIERNYPLPLEWADLYQTWNMDFCSRFTDWVYVIPKLFIPAVSVYQVKPQEYIYHRAIALYIYLNYASFDMVQKQKKGEAQIEWHDRDLMLLWGDVNARSAREYQEALKKARS